ncbi:laminin subunit alpha-1-like [Diaphorina citri]|uniref:Laminin subunit alpha-1-like n=1 Tax=Diaphorina citri TaxID=121845 RepID=A0A3Q0JH22_DIACI|nr:laminin subunit alpha-1-like [Diaphorina citri]
MRAGISPRPGNWILERSSDGKIFKPWQYCNNFDSEQIISLACVHNTEGPKCERCKVGFYGNAQVGTAEDCMQCACPMKEESNNFSPTCEGNGTEYICTQCPQGYIGDHCESCDAGYYGNPTELGGSCVPCSCGGGPCDASTGECVQCRGNTEGARCERCKPLYYGDPRTGDCKRKYLTLWKQNNGSNGLRIGSGNSQYDSRDNLTLSLPLLESHFYHIPPGLNDIIAEFTSEEMYMGGAVTKEQFLSVLTDVKHVLLRAKYHTDQAETSLSWARLETGSEDPSGQGELLDNIEQCTCPLGYRGLSCESCDFGYARVLPDNEHRHAVCTLCDCNKHAATCDPMSGQCSAHTTGVNCENCELGYYRPTGTPPDAEVPCLPCECNFMGTAGPCIRDDSQIHLGKFAGHCECLLGYAGKWCDRCAPGFHKFPNCEPCPCDIRGSKLFDTCATECECKENVEGHRCDQCKEGYFGLKQDNPEGCQACYCSGVSTHCTEAKNLYKTIEYQVTYVIMRAGISPRPGNWILERSSDGKIFKPWQYFAVSDDECWTQYGILASPANPLFLSDSDVICTSHYSKLKPLEGGEIHTSLVSGRPGANISSPDLSQFTRARFVRFRFQKINTPPDKFSQLVDNAYQKKLFYSIREIAVGAQCICNGHANRCKPAKGGSNGLRIGSGNSQYDSRDNLTLSLPLLESHFYHIPPGLNDIIAEFTSEEMYMGGAVTKEQFLSVLTDVKHVLLRAKYHTDQAETSLSWARLETGSEDPSGQGELLDNIEQCTCPLGYRGLSCESCDFGYARVLPDNEHRHAVCTLCDCNKHAATCDPMSGQCSEHWPVCCNCNRDGSLHFSCDVHTGQCSCKPNMTGLACDQCTEGHWGLQELGCASCECNAVGSVNNSCDQITGQCVCRKGVTGRTCDKCRPDYFGFSVNGCTECASCEQSGMVCSEESGQCVCPPLTRGDLCIQCAPNSYGYRPRLGCQPCRCDLRGSMRAQCDNITGDCYCRPGYTGHLCNQCAPGYYGYPKCKYCECNLAGSLSPVCDSQGQCPCKSNVEGRQCDQCRPGSFSLSADNLAGCTPCFCFNRSTHCTEAGVTWSQVRLPHPRALVVNYDNSSSNALSTEVVYPVNTHEICYVYLARQGSRGNVMKNQHKTKLNITNNLRIIPGDSEDVEIGVNFLYFDSPVYWSLPKQFLGDKIMSYGGFLRFIVETEGGTTLLPGGVLSSYPVIQIQGNDKLVLEYFPVIQNEGNRHAVRFHESLWHMKNNPTDPVSRQTLMLVLQNLQHVFIRATDSVDFTRATLKDISMDCGIILPSHNLSLLRQTTEPGIELCECPGQYAASSCQNPSIGFYRHKTHYSTHASSTIVIQLVGEARPCQCNNRSNVCHVETGHCLDCRDNTGGPHCELCAEGYYGAPPDEGTCRPCPCPSIHQNFAHSCLVSPGHETQCFCKPGYTGNLDNVNVRRTEQDVGSLGDECDSISGQCQCKENRAGRTCDQCASGLGSDHIVNGIIAPPWAPLLALDSNASVLEDTLQLWVDVDERMQGLPQQLEQDLVARAAYNLEQSIKLFRTCNQTALSGKMLRLHAEDLLAQVQANMSAIQGVVKTLSDYLHEDASLDVGVTLERAQQLLHFIRESDLDALGRFANKTFNDCTDILYHVKDKMTNRLTTEHVHNSIDILLDRIRDMNSKIQAILISNTNTRKMTESHRVLYAETEARVRLIDTIAEEVTQLTNQSDYYNLVAQVNLDEAEDDFVELEELSSELLNLSSSIEENEGILFNLNPQYRDRFVEPARRHVARLTEEAEKYAGLFNATRRDANIAVRASKAYQTIVDILEEARTAALDANKAAEEAYEQARPGTDSLIDQSTMAEEKSRVLKTISEAQLMKVTELQLQLNNQRSNVHNLTAIVRGMSKEEASVAKSVEDMLVSSGANVSNKMSGLNQRAYQYLDTSDKLFEQAAMLREHAQTELRPQLKLLSMEGAKNLNLANDKISEALLNSKKVQETFDSLKASAMKYTEVFTQWNQSISTSLASLRAKIQEARHAAEGIRLSLTSKKETGSCVRSYSPPKLEPTTRNDIVLTYAISSQHRDALLFYLPSKSSSRQSYYSVSLRRGQLDVRINAGRGEVRLASDSSEYNDAAFHSILVTKQGRRLELRVDDVVHALATLPEGSSVVRMPGQWGGLFFGGLPQGINTTGRAVSDVPLIGTIKDAIFNDDTWCPTAHGAPGSPILLDRIRDMNSKIQAILISNTNTRKMTESHRVLYVETEARVRLIDTIAEEVTQLTNQSDYYNLVAQVNLDEAEDDFVELEELSSELLNLSSSIEENEGILFNLNPQYRDRFVEPARRHVARLTEEAEKYAGLFNATRRDANIAVRASKAYQTIVDVLEEARTAALDANKAAEEAYEQARPGKEQIIMERNYLYKIEVQRIANVGYLLVRPVVLPLGSPLVNALPLSNTSTPGIGRLDVGPLDRAWVGGGETRPPYLLSRQSGLVGCLHHVALDGRPMGLWNFRSQSDTCTVCIEGAEESVQDELGYRFSGDGYSLLQHESISTYNKYLFSVSLSFRTFSEDALLLLAIGHQQARHAAEGIRLSLTSKKETGSCVRSYSPPKLEPTTRNDIVLTYAISSQHRDALLFYLPSKSSDDYLAVEMINRKIRFVWSLGGEPGEVTHPMHIQTAGDLANDH